MSLSTPSDVRTSIRFRITVIAIACIALALLDWSADETITQLGAVLFGYLRVMLPLVAILIVGRIALVIISNAVQNIRVAGQTAPRAYTKAIVEMPWGDIFTSISALAVTASGFTVFKSTRIGADGYLWDEVFIAWDRTIFGGTDPWVLSHQIFATPQATAILDFLYHPAFLPMALGYLLCIAITSRPALRYTYMTAYLAGFLIVGMLMASAFSSAGPVYDGHLFADGQTFGPLIERLAAQNTQDNPIYAVRLQAYLLDLHNNARVNFGGGISAMPSVHIVLVVIWTFAAWHIHKALGVLTTLYTVVIWIGSVHLGWHYAVDGLVSLFVMSFVWLIFGRIYRLM